jgi:NAD(P)-dependent dehydrogenase (short-subunit alcohol dehydrogenase family)
MMPDYPKPPFASQKQPMPGSIAYAREGADVLIALLNETEEANEVKQLVEKEGRKAVPVPGDLKDARHCRAVIKRAVEDLGGTDILVDNAAHQAVAGFCLWV